MNFAERVDSGTNPLSLAALDSCSPFCRLAATSSPGRGKSFHSGGALGKEGRSRPHSLTAGKSQPLSGKLYAPAKASPFRERWHGKAVTERVSPRLAVAFGECFPNRSRGKIGKSVCAKREHPLRRLLPSGVSHGRNVNKK